jgi:hypothetical protein
MEAYALHNPTSPTATATAPPLYCKRTQPITHPQMATFNQLSANQT